MMQVFKIKKLYNTLLISFLIFYPSGCTNKPEEKDIIGTWRSKDNSLLSFSKNGEFIGKNLLSYIFFPNLGIPVNEKFDGSGTWEIKKGKVYWELLLSFDTTSNGNNNYFISAYISENNESSKFDVFLWEGEDIEGDQYLFGRVVKNGR